jgi:hypothetical protein
MNAELLIVVPVLERPGNAAPLVQSVIANTEVAWRLVFVTSPGDYDEQFACDEIAFAEPRVSVLTMQAGPGRADFANKIQAGYESGDEPYVLLGADDLRFHPGWDTAALTILREHDVGVVGTVDLGNQQTVAGTHSTHPLVARCYIDSLGGVVGMPGQVYCPLYDHQLVDNELVQTALARGCYEHSYGSVVEHLHTLWGKAPMDRTYEKALREGRADRALFDRRKTLWEREKVNA